MHTQSRQWFCTQSPASSTAPDPQKPRPPPERQDDLFLPDGSQMLSSEGSFHISPWS